MIDRDKTGPSYPERWREGDALIAEKLFGFRWVLRANADGRFLIILHPLGAANYLRQNLGWTEATAQTPCDTLVRDVWQYHAESLGCDELLRRLAQIGMRPSVSCDFPVFWSAEVQHPQNGDTVSRSAPTMECAVALATVAAIEAGFVPQNLPPEAW